jgi:hypothetical protein
VRLAAISLEEIILVIVFVVLPVLQRVLGWLQRRARDAAAKRRADGALEEPARTAEPEAKPDSRADRGAFVEWLETQVGEGGASELPRTPPPFAPRRAERSFADAVEAGAPPAWEEVEEPEPALRPVAPTEARPTYAQISDFQSTSLEGLQTMPAAPDEDEVEAGGVQHVALAEIGALEPALPPVAPPVASIGLAGLGLTPRLPSEIRRPRRAAALHPPGRRGPDWSHAIVLAEVLGSPVSLRDPGGFAPGLER